MSNVGMDKKKQRKAKLLKKPEKDTTKRLKRPKGVQLGDQSSRKKAVGIPLI